jgi:phosphoglycerate dehydrogenase-like enzyme
MVDVDALADALKRGVIAGAGIDVFDREPPDGLSAVFDC